MVEFGVVFVFCCFLCFVEFEVIVILFVIVCILVDCLDMVVGFWVELVIGIGWWYVDVV